MEPDAQYPLSPEWRGFFSRAQGRGVLPYRLPLLFGLVYYLLGLVSLSCSHEPGGFSAIWVPTGMAFFLVLFGGYRWIVTPLIGMTLLGIHQQLPWFAIAGATSGATLEALLPVVLLRALGFNPELKQIRDVMLFITFGVVLGPVLAATLGTQGLNYAAVSVQTSLVDIWLLWWLGNSLGCLVIGGLLLVLATQKDHAATSGCRLFLLSLLGGVALTSMLSVMQMSAGEPTLLLFALVPLIVFAATYCGRQGAALLAFGATVASMLTRWYVPPDLYASHMVGLFSLDVALIWVASFTGLVVASAYSEHGACARYERLAQHDGLTNLLNRVTFMQRLSRALESARREGRFQVHALMFIDLDDFKQVNDRFGHPVGDQVLQRVSRILVSQVRGRDTVARLGGDEFVILLENCSAGTARDMAERIAAAIRGLVLHTEKGRCQVTASIGVAPVGAGTDSVDQALAEVDRAHYRAKGAGKNRVHDVIRDLSPDKG